jgi:hypothetical protein
MQNPNSSVPAEQAHLVSSTDRQSVQAGQQHQKQQDIARVQSDIAREHRQTGRNITENIGSEPPNTHSPEPGATSQAGQLQRQAQTAVQRLNQEGAGLPLPETSNSVAAAAAQAGLRHIEGVHLGTPQNGSRNLIVLDGDPNNAATKRVAIDSREAAQTPPGESLQRLFAATGGPRSPSAEPRMENPSQIVPEQPSRAIGGR